MRETFIACINKYNRACCSQGVLLHSSIGILLEINVAKSLIDYELIFYSKPILNTYSLLAWGSTFLVYNLGLKHEE